MARTTQTAQRGPRVVRLRSSTTARTRPKGMWRSLLALFSRAGRSAQVQQRRPNPFTPAAPYPGVVGEGARRHVPKIAMDAAEAWRGAVDQGPGGPYLEGGGWVGSYAAAYFASAYAEGQEWLGYAVLALLSQRPEYRIATDTYSTDMTREWIRFKSKSDDSDKQGRIDELVARLTELRLKQVMKAAIDNDGFQGRGQVYVDTGDEDDREELKTPIGSGGGDTRAKFGAPRRGEDRAPGEPGSRGKRIKRLAAIEPMWCYPSQYDASDPLRVDWYRPESWWVMGKEVHRTRLLTFVSNPVPDMLKPAYSFGGLSRTQMMKPYVDFWLRNRTSASDLLNNFSIPTLATTLDVNTMDEGSEVLQRILAFNVGRDNQATFVINKDEEEFEVNQTSLAGVEELVAQSAEHMSLPAGTQIETLRGQVPIEDVTIRDQVLTRVGYRRIRWVGATGSSDSLVRIETPEATIEPTGNHLVWSESTGEFVSAESVSPSHRLLFLRNQENTVSRSRGAVDGGGATNWATIATRGPVASYIASCGRRIRGLYQRIARFITPTTMAETIAGIIWSYSLAPSTPSGIVTSAGDASSSVTSASARGAAAPTRPSSLDTRSCAVLVEDVPIVRVSRIDVPRQLVYDIVVDGPPEFFANGVLVHNCVPSRIPIVKFFGDQPSGLNASSEGVIRLWYDNVHALQEGLIREPIQTVVNLAMVEMWGETDDDIEFEFVPLWQLDEAGRAAVQKTKADQRAVDVEAGAVSPEEARRAVAHDPDSQYAGLDLGEPLPEPAEEEDLFAEPGEEGGGGPGLHPSRRDLSGLTGQAARFGGAVTGGFSARDAVVRALEGAVRANDMTLGMAMDALERLDSLGRDWSESEHPRGQPGNAGQFASSSGEGSAGRVGPEDEAALRSYTGSGYREVNGHLRGGRPITEEGVAHLRRLDALLGAARTRAPQVVYRGLGSLAVQQLLGPSLRVKRGQVITDAGFPSTSADEGVARRFVQVNPAKNVMMAVRVPAGSRALDVAGYSDAPGEREVLIARNARLKVVGYDPKRRRLEVELMQHDDATAADSRRDAPVPAAPGDEVDKFGYATGAGLSISPATDDPGAEEFFLG